MMDQVTSTHPKVKVVVTTLRETQVIMRVVSTGKAIEERECIRDYSRLIARLRIRLSTTAPNRMTIQ